MGEVGGEIAHRVVVRLQPRGQIRCGGWSLRRAGSGAETGERQADEKAEPGDPCESPGLHASDPPCQFNLHDPGPRGSPQVPHPPFIAGMGEALDLADTAKTENCFSSAVPWQCGQTG